MIIGLFLVIFLSLILLLLTIIVYHEWFKERGIPPPILIVVILLIIILIIPDESFKMEITSPNFTVVPTITPTATVLHTTDEINGCGSQLSKPGTDSDSLWANLRSENETVRIDDETTIYLEATSKEIEKDLIVNFEVNLPSGFSRSSLPLGESPKIIRPGKKTSLEISKIRAVNRVKEPITVYIRYYYKDNQSNLKDVNLSLCVKVI